MSIMPPLTASYAEMTHPETVDRNRSGQITPLQAERVRQMLRHTRSSALINLAGAVSFPAIGATSVFGALAGPPLGPQTPLTTWVPLLLLVVIFAAVEIVFVRRVLRAWREISRTEADLRSRRVTAGDGVVTWGRAPGVFPIDMYVVRVGDLTLRSPVYKLQLPPGPYRCYYLAESGWLLSAQPLRKGPRGAAAQRDDELAAIARRHRFTEDDLAANREGRLSPRQARAIYLLVLLWLGLALLVGLGAVALTARLIGAPQVDLLVLAVLIWAGSAGAVVGGVRQLAEARLPRPILAAAGKLKVRYVTAGRTVTVYYDIDRVSLRLTSNMVFRQAYNSVIEGAPYRVYYLARSRLVASLEPVKS